MRLFDTHCHLNHEQFSGDCDEALARAFAAGVTELVVIGYDLPSSARAVELADQDRGVFATVGVHPHDAHTWDRATEAEIRRLADRPGVVAIGEIGLDFYRDLSPRPAQHSAFRAQLDIAAELRMPIVVHTRESVSPSLDVLEPYCSSGLRGVMHCWSGTGSEAVRARELGMLLGIGGVITYKNAATLVEVVTESPLESMVLETDAPYLSPAPHRGKRNEPAYIALVAARVAEIRGLDVESVAVGTRHAAIGLLGVESG